MPMSMVRRLQKSIKDLIQIEVSTTSFVGEVTRSLGVLPIKLIVGTQIVMIAFCIVKFSSSYNALLGKDWIHSNYYLPSLLY